MFVREVLPWINDRRNTRVICGDVASNEDLCDFGFGLKLRSIHSNDFSPLVWWRS